MAGRVSVVRLLHVDDEEDIRAVVEICFGCDPQFETRSCGSGKEAVAAVAKWPPDVILLDVMMPEMDGPTTLRKLRETEQAANATVIFMTARAQSRELDVFRSLGAAGVIPKPFDPMTLPASVKAYLKPRDPALDALRASFLKRLELTSGLMERWFADLSPESPDPVMLEEILRVAHGLAGAAGVFGFPEISDLAADIEDAVILSRGGAKSSRQVKLALWRFIAGAAAARGTTTVEDDALLRA
jgi:CheY-like chemotaxis protein